MKVVVIIPAAGLGTRMAPVTSKGKGPSKQFTELGGTPILIHTIRKFAASPRVNEIVVALRKDEMSGFQERLRGDSASGVSTKTRLVEGGEHRQHSVSLSRRRCPRA
jgi:2-C-methyl-D-erythritol 4-phosphate cytidylyltransferase